MPAVPIKPDIYWIGVNDRITDLFEGLWPITNEGVSYNSYLINDEKEIQEEWMSGVKVIGLTAGASTPEDIVQRCIRRLVDFGVSDVQDVVYTQEDVIFGLPKEILNAEKDLITIQ